MNKLLAFVALTLLTLAVPLPPRVPRPRWRKQSTWWMYSRRLPNRRGPKTDVQQKVQMRSSMQLDALIDFKKLTEGPVAPHRKSLSKTNRHHQILQGRHSKHCVQQIRFIF